MRELDAIKLAVVRRLAKTGEAKAIREQAGLSRPEVARVCDVSSVAVLRWERGERKPTGKPAIRYHDLLVALRGGDSRAAV